MSKLPEVESDLVRLTSGLYQRTAQAIPDPSNFTYAIEANPRRLSLLIVLNGAGVLQFAPQELAQIPVWMTMPTGVNWVLLKASDYPGWIGKPWLILSDSLTVPYYSEVFP